VAVAVAAVLTILDQSVLVVLEVVVTLEHRATMLVLLAQQTLVEVEAAVHKHQEIPTTAVPVVLVLSLSDM
jgi:hypothetical protein